MSPIPEDIDFGPAKDYMDMMQNLKGQQQVSKLKNNFTRDDS
jgi:hypothetical protein